MIWFRSRGSHTRVAICCMSSSASYVTRDEEERCDDWKVGLLGNPKFPVEDVSRAIFIMSHYLISAPGLVLFSCQPIMPKKIASNAWFQRVPLCKRLWWCARHLKSKDRHFITQDTSYDFLSEGSKKFARKWAIIAQYYTLITDPSTCKKTLVLRFQPTEMPLKNASTGNDPRQLSWQHRGCQKAL